MIDMMDSWLGISEPKQDITDYPFAFLKGKHFKVEESIIAEPRRGYVNGLKKEPKEIKEPKPVNTFWSEYEEKLIKKITLKTTYKSYYEKIKDERDLDKWYTENKSNDHKADHDKIKQYNRSVFTGNLTKL